MFLTGRKAALLSYLFLLVSVSNSLFAQERGGGNDELPFSERELKNTSSCYRTYGHAISSIQSSATSMATLSAKSKITVAVITSYKKLYPKDAIDGVSIADAKTVREEIVPKDGKMMESWVLMEVNKNEIFSDLMKSQNKTVTKAIQNKFEKEMKKNKNIKY
jgi:hypothetical protein